MFNSRENKWDSVVAIPNDRFTELVQKEERLSVLERMFAKSKFISTEDIKIVLGIEVVESENKDE